MDQQTSSHINVLTKWTLQLSLNTCMCKKMRPKNSTVKLVLTLLILKWFISFQNPHFERILKAHTHTKEATRLGERRDAFQREAGNSVSSWKRFFSLPCTSTMHYHLQHKNKKYVLEDFNLAGKSIASTSVWKLKLGKFKWGTLDRP